MDPTGEELKTNAPPEFSCPVWTSPYLMDVQHYISLNLSANSQNVAGLKSGPRFGPVETRPRGVSGEEPERRQGPRDHGTKAHRGPRRGPGTPPGVDRPEEEHC